MVTKICNQWPCERIDSSIYTYTHPDVNLPDAIREINGKLHDWISIRRLMVFLKLIDYQIRRLNNAVPTSNVIDQLVPWPVRKLYSKNLDKFYIDFNAKISEYLVV